MLRVLALVPYPTGRVPGQRYRIEQWAPLRALEVELTMTPALSPRDPRTPASARAVSRSRRRGLLTAHAGRHRLLRHLAGFDLAYVYREATLGRSDWFERRLAARLPFVLDFDDAIYLPAVSPANAAFAWLKDPGKTERLCRLARRVMVGNETLAASGGTALAIRRRRSEHHRHAGLPAAPAAPGDGARLPVIGWTGSATTVPYLEALAPALRAARLRPFELRVIGGEARLPRGARVRASCPGAPPARWPTCSPSTWASCRSATTSGRAASAA